MFHGHLWDSFSSLSSQGQPQHKVRRCSQEMKSYSWPALPCRASHGLKPGTSSRRCLMDLSLSSSGGRASSPRGPQLLETPRPSARADTRANCVQLSTTANSQGHCSPHPDGGKHRRASWWLLAHVRTDLLERHPTSGLSQKVRAESHWGG